MWTKTHSKTYKNLDKKAVWHLWTDINNWTSWHTDLEYCTMDAPFKEGAVFYLRPKGGPRVEIQITDIKEGVSFTDCTSFFGAKMYDTHHMEETPEGLRLTNTVTVVGPLRWLWIKLVAQNVADTAPQENDALAALAEKQYA